MKRKIILIAVISALLLSGAARADGDEKRSDKTHEGFYARLALGLAAGVWNYSSCSDCNGPDAYDILWGSTNASLGYFLNERWLLDLHFMNSMSNDHGHLLGVFGFAVGVNYFFRPSNIFFGAALYPDFGSYIAFSDKTSAGFMPYFGVHLTLGREWMINDWLSLGVAGAADVIYPMTFLSILLTLSFN